MSASGNRHPLDPAISRLEKFWLYETVTFYYLIGFDAQQTAFRMMKINRLIARPRSLGEIVRADGLVYSRSELVEILEMISEGNRSSGGITKVCSAFGLLGFVRFLDCYYFTLVTQRREVGCIAGNYVYSVKATEMFPVRPRDEPEANTFRKMWKKLNKKLNQTSAEIAESRYMGLFQFVDVTKDFFFSYSYDLTNSLQRNFLVCNNLAATGSSSATATSTGVAGENGRTTKPTGGPAEEKVEGNNGSSCTDGGVGGSGAAAGNTKAIPAPQEIFEWNYFQMHELRALLDEGAGGNVGEGSFPWVLPLMHGSFQQRRFSLFGQTLDVILLARRSRHYAGTRYLKRGVNVHGKAANDCEIEQIMQREEGYRSDLCAYLQMRGSIPTYWYQETSVTMPKPPILINRVDPDYLATQEHFADLFRRYSSPVIVLDLVKQQEKRARESIVGREFQQAVAVLNDSIALPHKIRYLALDYSKITGLAKARAKAGGKDKGGGGSAAGKGPVGVISAGSGGRGSQQAIWDAAGGVGGALGSAGGGGRAMQAVGNEWAMMESSLTRTSISAASPSPTQPSASSLASVCAMPSGGIGKATSTDDLSAAGSHSVQGHPYPHSLPPAVPSSVDVLHELEDIANMTIWETGFFCNTAHYMDRVQQLPRRLQDRAKERGHLQQRGVLRTNCIDCLDRTNGAQFAVAMKFLHVSLRALGIAGASNGKSGGGGSGFEASSRLLMSLMEMYGEMGDRIALQYGGSEAHKKVPGGGGQAAAASTGKGGSASQQSELLTSIKRYYSNAFTDMVKQDAMNVFLGCFVPSQSAIPLWDLESDYPLHNHALRPPAPSLDQVLFAHLPRYSAALRLQRLKLLMEGAVKRALLLASTGSGASGSGHSGYEMDGAGGVPLLPSGEELLQSLTVQTADAAGAEVEWASFRALQADLPQAWVVDVLQQLRLYFLRNVVHPTATPPTAITTSTIPAPPAMSPSSTGVHKRGALLSGNGRDSPLPPAPHHQQVGTPLPKFRSKGALHGAIRAIARLERRKLFRRLCAQKVPEMAESWWRLALEHYSTHLAGLVVGCESVGDTTQARTTQARTTQAVMGAGAGAESSRLMYYDRAYVPQQLTEFDALLGLEFFAPVDAVAFHHRAPDEQLREQQLRLQEQQQRAGKSAPSGVPDPAANLRAEADARFVGGSRTVTRSLDGAAALSQAQEQQQAPRSTSMDYFFYPVSAEVAELDPARSSESPERALQSSTEEDTGGASANPSNAVSTNTKNSRRRGTPFTLPAKGSVASQAAGANPVSHGNNAAAPPTAGPLPGHHVPASDPSMVAAGEREVWIASSGSFGGRDGDERGPSGGIRGEGIADKGYRLGGGDGLVDGAGAGSGVGEVEVEGQEGGAGGFMLTRYVREIGLKARTLVGGLGGYILRRDTDAATSAPQTRRASESRAAPQSPLAWEWQHLQLINFHTHRVSKSSSLLYARYVSVAECPLVLMEAGRGSGRGAEEEYYLLLRDQSVDVDNVAGMEHLSVEAHISSEVGQVAGQTDLGGYGGYGSSPLSSSAPCPHPYQGMHQRDSAVMAHGYLAAALLQVEAELRACAVTDADLEQRLLQLRSSSSYPAPIAAGTHFQRQQYQQSHPQQQIHVPAFPPVVSRSRLQLPSTALTPRAGGGASIQCQHVLHNQQQQLAPSRSPPFAPVLKQRGGEALGSDFLPLSQRHNLNAAAAATAGVAPAMDRAGDLGAPQGDKMGANKSGSLAGARGQLLRSALEVPAQLQYRIERSIERAQVARGLELELKRCIHQYVLQQYLYSRELSWPRLQNRLGAFASERVLVEYCQQFDQFALACDFQEADFQACDSQQYESFSNLLQLQSSLLPLRERLVRRKRALLRKHENNTKQQQQRPPLEVIKAPTNAENTRAGGMVGVSPPTPGLSVTQQLGLYMPGLSDELGEEQQQQEWQACNPDIHDAMATATTAAADAGSFIARSDSDPWEAMLLPFPYDGTVARYGLEAEYEGFMRLGHDVYARRSNPFLHLNEVAVQRFAESRVAVTF